jgi:hypothetical protein
MLAMDRQRDVIDSEIMNKLGYMEKGIDGLDKKIEKLDTRQWQIIILLLSYPLGLLIGKLTHVF